METLPRYPAFSYDSSIVTDGRILLIDEPISSDIRTELASLNTVDKQDLVFLEDRLLADRLEPILRQLVLNDPETLFVFPGNGSNYPRRYSQIWQDRPNASVPARRFWHPGADPIALVGRVLPELFLIIGVGVVLVVDDVISSGQTLSALYQNNAWRFPRARWLGAAWVAQLPRMKSISGVKGYQSITAACLVQKRNGTGRVPINSLSTLRLCPEIAESYASRHFVRPADFLSLIRQRPEG
ncbi:MAG: hypothetical protein WC497_02185 [Patescibacteria group bacterium]